MIRRATDAAPLAGWTVISLRPRGQHAALRAAAARAGARVLALSPLAIEQRTDAAIRRILDEALSADTVLFTSPNAVLSASALRRLRNVRGRSVLAVGDGTRRALQRLGVDAQSPTRMDSEGLLAMPALREALAADVVLFTSPNAVNAAAALRRLGNTRGRPVLAVGDGTRRALRRLGVDAISPSRMDSEGLLAMPPLRDIAGRCIGLVTAPGGRNRLAPALRARGAEVRRADVYERMPATIARARWHALAAALAAPTRVVLALSSSEALEAVLRQRPADLETPLRAAAVTAASERLAQAARDAGFRRITIATDARPASLLRAAADAFV